VLPVIQAMTGEVLLTTGTLSSARLAAARLPAHARHQFAPLDHPGWVKKFLEHWRPDAAVFVESELWPNMLDLCDARGIPRMLINARMSARSAANWRRLPSLARRMLGPFRYIHAQSAGDADNLRSLGVRDVLEWGNLKFFTPVLPGDPHEISTWRDSLAGPHWLAASTHPGEEAIILQVHEALLAEFPELVTVIVPRHPERGAELAALTGGTRRSLGEAPMVRKIHLADTLGELGIFFRAASFAFIGNSLVGFGGHNVIEPAMLGCAVIAGPHLENFSEAAAILRNADGISEVTDAATLAAAVANWLRHPEQASKAGMAARAAFPAGDLPARLASLIEQTALA
jgi:3-deoxy-D-manno-octulosonic-acid transferase